MTPMKWFFSFLKKYRRHMILGIILTILITALNVVNPQISGFIVDDVIDKENYSKLLPAVLCMVGVILVRSVMRFFYQYVFETASQGVLYDMRDKVYRKLLQEDFRFYNKKRTGDLMSRQTGDMDAIRHFVAYVVYATCEQILMFVFALAMIFTVNVKLALCMLVVLPFTAFATYRQSKEVKPAFKRNRECFSSLNAFVQENVSGNRVVRAFSKEEFEIEKFNIKTFNRCENENRIMFVTENSKKVYPFCKCIPLSKNYSIPFGLYYSKNANERTMKLIELIKSFSN